MRIAIMSDVHGFDLALRAVLADIDQHGSFDRIVVAGDLCEIGPRPDEVVRLLQERGIEAVKGNTDLELVRGDAENTTNAELRYGIEMLGPHGIAYLSALPCEIRVSPPGGEAPSDDLLIVHANPHNLDDPLDPRLTDDELLAIIEPCEAAMIAFGHIHICYVRRVGPYELMDVSAVGNPKDGDLRGKWGIARWDERTRKWSGELRSVAYPLEETRAEIVARGVPSAKKVIRKLEQATYRHR